MKTTKLNLLGRALCAFLLACGLVVTGCEDGFLGSGEDTEQGENGGAEGDSGQTDSQKPLTLDLKSYTATTAVFTGMADLDGLGNYSEFGIALSYDEEFGNDDDYVLRITSLSDGNKYTKTATGLLYGKKIYYTTYLCKVGVYLYGEVCSLTTDNVAIPLSTSSITATTAQISGVVEGLSEVDKSQIEVGMFYSSEEGKVELGHGTKLTASEIPSDNAVSFDLTELAYSTTYYYCSYVKQGDGYVYGEVNSFTLPHPYIVQSDLNMSAATDLSSSATANSYIVSKEGLYKIKTVKGNSTTSVGSVVSAAILWETFGTSTTPNLFELIKGVCYKDGYIAFQTADTFKEGNALIAAKDADGNILWSWHIWFTDEPQGQEYYNNAGTMMDRNLGATSATPGDVGALGLLYQWGRKDPFLGSSSISSSTLAKSTITWPSTVSSDSSNGTIAYATAHPTTFITYNKSNWDWYYTGSSSTDNTRWTASDKPKSIYDPCPAGWRVPDSGSNGVWSKALGSSSYFEDDSLYNSSNEGMNFSGKFGSASTIWYPVSGYRGDRDGSLYSVGYDGDYWSASPCSNYAYRLNVGSYGGVFPSSGIDRAYGLSVRCLQVID